MASQLRPRYDSVRSSQSSIVPGWSLARPPSPSYTATTTESRVNLPAAHMLITRKDLAQSIACFEDLMAAAKAYRNALLAMSTATAAFASAMEACSRVKGCRSANSAMAGAGGLQFLISNHEQILADTVYRQFEIPLLEALDDYKLITADRLVAYEKSLHEQSGKIRKTEAENLMVGRRKKRDLQQFRQALADLQRQVDELDAIKATYHEEVLDGEDEVWDSVLSKVAFVVRSQLDFYEKIAGKVSDPVLEPLVMSIPDPFDAYGPPKEEGHIISVLAPLGMMDTSVPQSPNPELTRPSSSMSNHTSGQKSPKQSVPFPAVHSSLSLPQTSSVSAAGQSGSAWSDDEEEAESRAKRELSVIEEREATASLAGPEEQDEVQANGKPQYSTADSPGWGGKRSSQIVEEDRVEEEDDRPTVNEGSDVESPSGSGTIRPVGVTA